MAATVLRVWLFSMLFSSQVVASALPCFFDSFDETREMTVLKDEGEFGLESLNGRAGPTTLVTFFALPSFKIIYILITAQHWQGDKACLRFPSGPLPREVLPLLPLWLERQSQTNGHSGSGHALWGRDIFCVQFLKVKATNLGFFYHNSAHIQFPAHWIMRFPWCHSWAPILPWRRCDQLLLLSPLKTVWKSNTRSQFLWIHCWEKKIWSNRKTYFNHKYRTGFMVIFCFCQKHRASLSYLWASDGTAAEALLPFPEATGPKNLHGKVVRVTSFPFNPLIYETKNVSRGNCVPSNSCGERSVLS